MAKKQVWLGSVGPSLYNDDRNYALETDGVLSATGKPTNPNDLIRLVDLEESEDNNKRYAFMLSVC